MTPREVPAEWLDRFFDDYYADHPVNGTFIGVHDRDHELPDASESALSGSLARMRDRIESLPTGAAPGAESTDVRLAEGFLRLRSWELESGHFLRRNPSWYTGEAAFGVLSLFLSDFAPLSARADAAEARIRAIPRLLEQASANVRSAPRPWIDRALRECASMRRFFDDGLQHIDAGEDGALTPAQRSRLRTAADEATRHINEHSVALESLSGEPVDAMPGIGEEAFDMHLRLAHGLTESADEILRRAEDEIERVRALLPERARALGAATPADILQSLREVRPNADEYVARYGAEWDRCRAFVQERDLLSWPDFPIEYVERPLWSRAAAPGLYFLFYRAPATYGRPEPHRYLVAPLDRGAPQAEQEDFLRANNDSVIRLNHVIHHGGVGHHVQNWHAYRAESRVGRMAAVDCASRIAMHCGATMAEGWACYATDLMREMGALTPAEEFAEMNGRIRMAARTVVDIQLHRGRMSLAEAARYYQEVAGMPEGAAQGEATKNSMFPAAALIYFVGSDLIHQLRATMTARPGWSLKRFHDEFLSYGSIPVALIGQAMEARDDHATV